jgi:hypothetical protein
MLERYFRVICAKYLRVGAARRSELVETKVKTLLGNNSTALSALFIYLQAHSATAAYARSLTVMNSYEITRRACGIHISAYTRE